MEIVSGTCVWYHTGMPAVPMRWVLIRDPQGKFDPQALLCTKLEAAPVQVLAWFVRRWHVEIPQPYYGSRESLSLAAA